MILVSFFDYFSSCSLIVKNFHPPPEISTTNITIVTPVIVQPELTIDL